MASFSPGDRKPSRRLAAAKTTPGSSGAGRPSSMGARTRARLYWARSASPRRAHATTVRYPERTSFSSSGSASVNERAAVSALWALKAWG
jgi:hypothetical protein